MDRNPPMTLPHDAREAGGSPAERIAERLGMQASAHAVFGEPVERDGVTVVPVAQVRYVFGGGGGEGPQGEGTGSGGGGAVRAEPVGFIRLARGKARFQPILQPQARARAMLTTLAGVAVGVFVMAWGVRALQVS